MKLIRDGSCLCRACCPIGLSVAMAVSISACGADDDPYGIKETETPEIEHDGPSVEVDSPLYRICDELDWDSLELEEVADTEITQQIDEDGWQGPQQTQYYYDTMQGCEVEADIYIDDEFLDEDDDQDSVSDYRVMNVTAGFDDFEHFEQRVESEEAQYLDHFVHREDEGLWTLEGDLGTWDDLKWRISENPAIEGATLAVGHDHRIMTILFRSDGEFLVTFEALFWFDGDFDAGVEHSKDALERISDDIYESVVENP